MSTVSDGCNDMTIYLVTIYAGTAGIDIWLRRRRLPGDLGHWFNLLMNMAARIVSVRVRHLRLHITH